MGEWRRNRQLGGALDAAARATHPLRDQHPPLRRHRRTSANADPATRPVHENDACRSRPPVERHDTGPNPGGHRTTMKRNLSRTGSTGRDASRGHDGCPAGHSPRSRRRSARTHRSAVVHRPRPPPHEHHFGPTAFGGSRVLRRFTWLPPSAERATGRRNCVESSRLRNQHDGRGAARSRAGRSTSASSSTSSLALTDATCTRCAPPVASVSTLTPGASFGGHPRPAAAAAESPRTRSRSPPGAGRQALTMDKDRGGFDPAVHGPALPVST